VSELSCRHAGKPALSYERSHKNRAGVIKAAERERTHRLKPDAAGQQIQKRREGRRAESWSRAPRPTLTGGLAFG